MRIVRKATSAIILKRLYERSSDLSGRSLLGDEWERVQSPRSKVGKQ
jgi:hypothetical protein